MTDINKVLKMRSVNKLLNEIQQRSNNIGIHMLAGCDSNCAYCLLLKNEKQLILNRINELKS